MSKTYIVTVEGVSYEVVVEEGTVGAVSAPAKAAAPAAPVAPKAAAGGVKVTSPLPGTLLRYVVKNGGTVQKDELICIVEAMKMENEIFATASGTVTYAVSEGATLNPDDVIATIA